MTLFLILGMELYIYLFPVTLNVHGMVVCTSLQARTDPHSHTNFKSLTKEELAIRAT